MTQEDVWGQWAADSSRMVSIGMIVAYGIGSDDPAQREQIIARRQGITDLCPVWKDVVPYKSVTVICKEEEAEEVEYWLSYVHAGPISKRKNLPNGKVALRSDYQAW